MVWARIYEDTKELWKEGNFLRIEGKVKIREERVQFTCDAVEIYKPDDAVKPHDCWSKKKAPAERRREMEQTAKHCKASQTENPQ